MENTSNLSYSEIKKDVVKAIDKIRRSIHVKQSAVNNDFRNIEQDIEDIRISANNNKNILEECENDLQEQYKIDSAKIQSDINILSVMNFFVIAAILEIFHIYLGLTIQKIPDILPAITIISGLCLAILKLVYEKNIVSCISKYEYCIKLLKNAKIRAESFLLDSDNQSLDRITVNPNKMNGQS